MARCAQCGKGLLAADRAAGKCGRCGVYMEPRITHRFETAKGRRQRTTPPYRKIPESIKNMVCHSCYTGDHEGKWTSGPFCACCRTGHVEGGEERDFDEITHECKTKRGPKSEEEEWEEF